MKNGISVEALVFAEFEAGRKPPKLRKSNKTWKHAMRKQLCFYCNKPGGTVDHVMPVANQGRDAFENCVPACSKCNVEKDKLHPQTWFEILWKQGDERAAIVASLLEPKALENTIWFLYDRPSDWQRIQSWPNLEHSLSPAQDSSYPIR